MEALSKFKMEALSKFPSHKKYITFSKMVWLCGWESKQMPIFSVPTRPMCWAVEGPGADHPHKVYCLLPYRRYWAPNRTRVSLALTKPWAKVGSLLLKQQWALWLFLKLNSSEKCDCIYLPGSYCLSFLQDTSVSQMKLNWTPRNKEEHGS